MIPYSSIRTLFLDAGNTLISIDFEWVRQLLAARGVHCSLETLQRAEAAARPAVSNRLAELGGTESHDTLRCYLAATLDGLQAATGSRGTGDHQLLDNLVAEFTAPGMIQRLWSRPLPGIPACLDRLQAAGFVLVVVSNSDGTVGDTLERLGMTKTLHAVIESHHVGWEKPDPKIFQHALEIAGAEADTTLHLGDLYHADVEGARAAGVHAALVDPFDDWTDVDCERVPGLETLTDTLLSHQPARPQTSNSARH